MRHVTALVLDPVAIADLRAAAGGGASVHFVDRADALCQLWRRGRVDAVVVEVGDGRARTVCAAVGELRQRFSSLPIIACARIGTGVSSEVTAVFKAGADHLVLYGVDGLQPVLSRVLEHSPEWRHAAYVLDQIATAVPPDLMPTVTCCLDHLGEPFGVTELARAHRVHRKTLVNRFARAGWPPPSRIIGWCRVLVAARLLDEPGRTLAQTASLVGCPSPHALRVVMRRYTGWSPQRARARGFDAIVALFRDAVGVSGDKEPTTQTRCRESLAQIGIRSPQIVATSPRKHTSRLARQSLNAP